MTQAAAEAQQQQNIIAGLDLGPYLAGEPGAIDTLAQQLRYTCENVGCMFVNESTQRDTAKVLAMPEVRERLINNGQDPVGSTPKEFEAKVAADAAKFARVIKEAKIPLQD